MLLTGPKRRGQEKPGQATRGSTRVGVEAEGTRGRHGPEPLS